MRYLSQVGLFVFVFYSHGLMAAEIAERNIKILGKSVSVSQSLSATEDGSQDSTSESGVESTSQVNLFGKKIEILKNSVQYRVSEGEGLSFDNKFYVKGKKVLGHSFANGDGSFAYNVDIPYTEISGDVFSYSIGILSLGVHSGVTYEGSLNSQVSSEFLRKKEDRAVAVDMNLVNASAGVDVLARGFVEGQVKILFIKGAIGGALNLIDGEAKASISVTPETITHPEVAYGGIVNLLSGSIYGYVGSGNTKWLNGDLYKHKGFCYAFGDNSCPK